MNDKPAAATLLSPDSPVSATDSDSGSDCSVYKSQTVRKMQSRLSGLSQEIFKTKLELALVERECIKVSAEAQKAFARINDLVLENHTLKYKIECLENEKCVMDLQNTVWIARFTNLSSRFRELNQNYSEFASWMETMNH
jgi:hypothetical protein